MEYSPKKVRRASDSSLAALLGGVEADLPDSEPRMSI